MLAAVKDKDVVVPVHADAADFLERPAGWEFRPILHGFVRVRAAANGSHALVPLFVAAGSLSRSKGVDQFWGSSAPTLSINGEVPRLWWRGQRLGMFAETVTRYGGRPRQGEALRHTLRAPHFQSKGFQPGVTKHGSDPTQHPRNRRRRDRDGRGRRVRTNRTSSRHVVL